MTPLRIFVRRGAIRRFNLLKRDAAGLPVSVEWDRRQRDRQAESDPADAKSSSSERRSEPPFTWTTAEFVIVNDTADEAS